jgi:hypothetical protein
MGSKIDFKAPYRRETDTLVPEGADGLYRRCTPP